MLAGKYHINAGRGSSTSFKGLQRHTVKRLQPQIVRNRASLGNGAHNDGNPEEKQEDQTTPHKKPQNKALRKNMGQVGKKVTGLVMQLSQSNQQYLSVRDRDQWWSKSTFGHVRYIPQARINRALQTLTNSGRVYLKFWQLSIILACACSITPILTIIKDFLILKYVGAEVFPYLATYFVLPFAMAYFAFYSKVVTGLPRRYQYAAALTPLFAIYLIFAWVIYPNHATLHFTGLTAAAGQHLPAAVMAIIKPCLISIENWGFTLFYCAADVQATVSVAFLFWSLAQQVCSLDEAKVVFPTVGIVANLAFAWMGGVVKSMGASIANHQVLLTVTAILGVIMVGLEANLAQKHLANKEPTKPKAKTEKPKSSMKDIIGVLKEDPLYRNLAYLVLCFGVSAKLFEFSFKGMLSAFALSDLQVLLSSLQQQIGLMTVCMMVLGSVILNRFGWLVAALIPPVILTAGGLMYYASGYAWHLGVTQHTTVLASAALAAGAVTQVFIKASKYSLVDPCKEMVYITCDEHTRQRGKAVVDMLGQMVGKSGGAWVVQLVVIVFPTLADGLGVMGAAYAGIMCLWIFAVLGLWEHMKAHDTRPEGYDSDAPQDQTPNEPLLQSPESPLASQSSGSTTENGQYNGSASGSSAASDASSNGSADEKQGAGYGAETLPATAAHIAHSQNPRPQRNNARNTQPNNGPQIA